MSRQCQAKLMEGPQSFRLAPMCPVIWTLTIGLLALPVGFVMGAAYGHDWLVVPAVLTSQVYAWVWLRFRPQLFVVHADRIEIVWPCKRRETAWTPGATAHVASRAEIRREVGWAMRIGAGGLWGGFGWLWTSRRGIVQMYISRLDRFVWIELPDARPWLITPEDPERFVQALSGTS